MGSNHRKHKAPFYGVSRLWRIENSEHGTIIVQYKVHKETSLHIDVSRVNYPIKRIIKQNKDYWKGAFSSKKEALENYLSFQKDRESFHDQAAWSAIGEQKWAIAQLEDLGIDMENKK